MGGTREFYIKFEWRNKSNVDKTYYIKVGCGDQDYSGVIYGNTEGKYYVKDVFSSNTWERHFYAIKVQE